MIPRLFGIKDAVGVNYFEWYLRQVWPRWLLVLLLGLALAYVVYIYSREKSLGVVRRWVLGSLRLAVCSTLLVMLFQPGFSAEITRRIQGNVLVLVDRSQSMGIQDKRNLPQQQAEAALALGKIRYDQAETAVLEPYRAEIERATRLDLAKGILGHPEVRPFERIALDHPIRYFSFGQRLSPVSGEGELSADSLKSIVAADKSTSLGSAIEEAVSRYSGQPISAVVLLTDGGSNEGVDPLDVARRMKAQSIQIFPVGIGLSDPSDVIVRDVVVQDTVFSQERVPVRVQIQSNGFNHQPAQLVLSLDGKEIEHKAISLAGGVQFEEFMFTPERKSGDVKLSASVRALPGETVTGNNTMQKNVKVIDEKIKVLYVEGKPRWEYRYLRAVLLRDRRLEVKFLMTQGDRDLARFSPDLYIDRFPDEAAEASRFHLVIIGDVPATYFTTAQMQRIEQWVGTRGGSLLMLAGHRYAPVTYNKPPIADMLPVRISTDAAMPLDPAAYPVPTEAGLASSAVALEASAQITQKLWAAVKPLARVPALAGAKQGATVLAELTSSLPGGKEKYPLICWQRYGQGKVMYVGTDQLWRLRFEQGDKYHARFWGQAIQFLTLSQLIAGNKRITIETDRKAYNVGDRVQVFANVLNTAYEPVRALEYLLNVSRKDGVGDTTQVKLSPVPDVPGLFQGVIIPDKEGQFLVRPDVQSLSVANIADFEVQAVSQEFREPAMQESLLRKMAEISGGKYISINDLRLLPAAVGTPPRTAIERREMDLWDQPLLYCLVVLLAGAEWYVRRRSNLL